MLADIQRDRLVHLVAGRAHRLAVDDAGQRDHRDLGRPPADVHDQVAARLLDLQAGADGGGHRLFHEKDSAGAGLHRRLADRALLDLGDAGGHADHDPRLEDPAARLDPGDEVAEHGLGDVEVGDDPVLEGAHHLDVARCAAEHGLGGVADGDHRPLRPIQRDNGGLRQHDPLAADVHERVGGTEIDPDVVDEDPGRQTKFHQTLPPRSGDAPRL